METTKMTRKFSSRVVKDQDLQKDLLTFKQKALELGASDAAVIPASDIVIQERIWMKCLIPRCRLAGRSPYCPPNSPQPEIMRKVISQYTWGVLFKRDIPNVADYTRTAQNAVMRSEIRENKLESFHGKTYEIASLLESFAQTNGYDLAMGFSGGSCNHVLCGGVPCTVLQNETCRHSLRARPSLEGVGIDVFDLVSKVGWKPYMIRIIEPVPHEIPCAMSVGLVLIY